MKGIKVNGTEYPAGLTMWAQLQFKRDKGKQVTEIEADDIEGFLYYCWLRVKGACLRSKIEFPFSFDDFVINVEGDPTEALLEPLIAADDLKKKTEPS